MVTNAARLSINKKGFGNITCLLICPNLHRGIPYTGNVIHVQVDSDSCRSTLVFVKTVSIIAMVLKQKCLYYLITFVLGQDNQLLHRLLAGMTPEQLEQLSEEFSENEPGKLDYITKTRLYRVTLLNPTFIQ